MTTMNRRRMLTLAGATAALSPVLLARPAAATIPGAPTGSTVILNEPARIYDSRSPLGGGPARKIRARERFSLGLGEDSYGFIAGAFINLTVTQTQGSGFLTVQSYGIPTPIRTSNINWTGDGQTIANSSLVPVGGESVIDIICSGGDTHFIVDLQGYIPYLV